MSAIKRASLASELQEDEVHLWLTSSDDGLSDIDGGVLPDNEHTSLLSAEEQQQLYRFKFFRDRARYLKTRRLVRTILSRYLGIDPSQLSFVTNPYGRPAVANQVEATAALSLNFNISHTAGMIALAITRGREIGVDVENAVEKSDLIDIAEKFFSPMEIRDLSKVPIDEQPFRFFEYWTFKEAYIKARGMGLSIPLHKFSFHYPSSTRVDLQIDADLADDPRRWFFLQLMPTSKHVIALCVERRGISAPKLIVKKIGVGDEEIELCPQLLRTSDSD